MSSENSQPERSNIPELPELSEQLQDAGQAFLDALVPDKAALEMQRLHGGSVPVGATARDTIRLGHALGFCVEETGDENYGYPVFRWTDDNGDTVYEGAAQHELTQLALMFAAKRLEQSDDKSLPNYTPTNDFTFTMPFNVVDHTNKIIVQHRVETAPATVAIPVTTYTTSPAPAEPYKLELPEGELTAFDYVGFSFGPSRATHTAQPAGFARVPAAQIRQEQQDENTSAAPQNIGYLVPEPGPRHKAPTLERFAKLRRKVASSALAAIALVGGAMLTSDGSPAKTLHTTTKESTLQASLKGKHRKPSTVPQSVTRQMQEPAGTFWITSTPAGEVQSISGTMNEGQNPWHMTEQALQIAGIQADAPTITEADPYLRNRRAKQAAQHLGAGAIMQWRVVHIAGATQLVPVALPFKG